jgi:peroxiredoxin
VRAYLDRHKLTFAVLLDRDSRVSTLYGVRATPTRLVITRAGMVVAGSIGPRDWDSEEARRLIAALLATDGKPS